MIKLSHAGESYHLVDLKVNPSLGAWCAERLVANPMHPNLRDADLREIEARSGIDPMVALLAGILHGVTCWAVIRPPGMFRLTSEVVGMCGVGPSGIETVGEVWFLGTDLISHKPVAFTKLARRMLDDPRFTGGFPILHNYVDERNTAHIRWLASLGFTFIARHPRFGVAGLPFLEFLRVRPDVRTHNDVCRHRRVVHAGGGRADDGSAATEPSVQG